MLHRRRDDVRGPDRLHWPSFRQTGVPVRVPTIDQSLEMSGFAAPKLSPDGKHVVQEQSRTNWEANAFETDLRLAVRNPNDQGFSL